MAEWLLLRMPRAADEPAEWLVCDAQGFAAGTTQHGALSEAAVLATGRRLAVLVSAADALLTAVELPPRAGARVLQMTRFALEEQLLGDIDAQHFALGRRAPDGRTPVAVATRAMMQSWLENLRTAGLQPELLCTDAALLPAQPMQTVAWIDGDMLTLVPQRPLAEAAAQVARASAMPGEPLVCLPAEDPSGALGLAFGESPTDAIDLTVYATPADWARYGERYEALRPRLGALHVQLLGGGPLPWLAPQLSNPPPLNLLQGEFATSGATSNTWPRWRLAAALAAALLVLHVGDRAYTLWGLRRAETVVDGELTKLGETALPGTRIDTGSVRRQVAERLAATQARDAGVMLQSLQTLAHSLGAADGKLRSLSFRDGNTELLLRARDAQTLERLKQSLRKDGMNAELVGGGAGTSGLYEGHIQIKTGGGRS
jgi:general secretion pathway protein L